MERGKTRSSQRFLLVLSSYDSTSQSVGCFLFYITVMVNFMHQFSEAMVPRYLFKRSPVRFGDGIFC